METKNLNEHLDRIIVGELMKAKKNRTMSDAVIRKYEKARSSRNNLHKEEMIKLYEGNQKEQGTLKQHEFNELKKVNPKLHTKNDTLVHERKHKQ